MSPERAARADGGWVTARPRRAGEVLLRLVAFPLLVVRQRDLIATLVRRDFAARLAGTVLGRAWPVLHPLLVFAIYYFVFTKLLGFRMPNLAEEHRAAMGVYMFVGVVVWTAFGDSVNRSTAAIVEQGNLIKKVAFPSEVLPLNVVLVSILTMLIGLAVFALACLLTPIWPAPGAALLWVPLVLLLQILFTTGICLATATLHVFLRDTQHLIVTLVTVWMFVTPVFWVPTPEVVPGIAAWLPWIEANPLHHLVYAWRAILMSGEPAFVFTESLPRALATFAPWALGSFLVGYAFFTVSRHRFADEV